MRFGICTSIDQSSAAKAAGWDFIEETVQGLLQGSLADNEWNGAERARQSALPILAANMLLPGSLKITGPHVDQSAIRDYLLRVVPRAKHVGIDKLVFGSGGARNVPEGFGREVARSQIQAFARLIAGIAAENGITIVAEHLRREECNIINTVAEATEYVRTTNSPSFQCLVDSYHLWCENEPLDNVKAAMPWIRHVHLADKDERVAPGLSGAADYRPLFRLLRAANYDGLISVEALSFDIAKEGARVLAFLKDQWEKSGP